MNHNIINSAGAKQGKMQHKTSRPAQKYCRQAIYIHVKLSYFLSEMNYEF